MQLTSTSFADNARIPDHCAFGNPDPAEHMRLGANRNPQLSWSGVPEVDIAPLDSSIAAGSCSDGVTTRGKKTPPGPENTRQGINDYTGFMAGDADMGGEYFGYDGPCPPWNDERLHHYHFILYATDLVTCPVQEAFTATDVKRAIDSHILAEARLVGTYSLNPEVR
jgi:phosphatidylethanolamine-binding protein (PEBP) family uncharacterized protein